MPGVRYIASGKDQDMWKDEFGSLITGTKSVNIKVINLNKKEIFSRKKQRTLKTTISQNKKVKNTNVWKWKLRQRWLMKNMKNEITKVNFHWKK